MNELNPICDCAPDCAERIACTTVGDIGHYMCGWCDRHDRARHACGCVASAGGAA